MLLDRVPNEAWQKMMSVDLNGVFYGLCAQLHQIVTCGGGAIVNVVSVSGRLFNLPKWAMNIFLMIFGVEKVFFVF